MAERSGSAQPVLLFVRGSADPNSPMPMVGDPGSTLLWTSRPGPMGRGMPVIAPDGHQLMLGEFLMSTGKAEVECTGRGTRSELHYKHLIPNATYTVWQLAFDATGNLLAIGALGPNDGSRNSFHSSSNGEGELSTTTPAGPLSMFGSLGACALDQFDLVYALAYHIDGMTHGPTPGPDGTYAEQNTFDFRRR